jgi:hypothetical protein
MVWIFPVVLFLFSFCMYVGVLFFFHYNILFNICGTLIETLKSYRFYFNLLLVIGFNFIVDFAVKSYNFLFDFQVSKELLINNKHNKTNKHLIKKFFNNVSNLSGIIINEKKTIENIDKNSLFGNNISNIKKNLYKNKTLNFNLKYQSQIYIKRSVSSMNLNDKNSKKKSSLANSKVIKIKGLSKKKNN